MILIVDFGSQYNQLIARRVRECNVYCRIIPPSGAVDEIKASHPQGVILSGGPAGVYEKDSPKINREIFNLGIPILGICYGMHFMIDAFGGKVRQAEKREYGFANLSIKNREGLFAGVENRTQCWMSHGDSPEALPEGFVVNASTDNTEIAAIVHKEKKNLWSAIPPRSRPYAQRQENDRKFSFRCVRLPKNVDDEIVRQRVRVPNKAYGG